MEGVAPKKEAAGSEQIYLAGSRAVLDHFAHGLDVVGFVRKLDLAPLCPQRAQETLLRFVGRSRAHVEILRLGRGALTGP